MNAITIRVFVACKALLVHIIVDRVSINPTSDEDKAVQVSWPTQDTASFEPNDRFFERASRRSLRGCWLYHWLAALAIPRLNQNQGPAEDRHNVSELKESLPGLYKIPPITSHDPSTFVKRSREKCAAGVLPLTEASVIESARCLAQKSAKSEAIWMRSSLQSALKVSLLHHLAYGVQVSGD